ncbi:MAG: DUF4157 domain-containing protein [Saprospiraceae bacterium]
MQKEEAPVEEEQVDVQKKPIFESAGDGDEGGIQTKPLFNSITPLIQRQEEEEGGGEEPVEAEGAIQEKPIQLKEEEEVQGKFIQRDSDGSTSDTGGATTTSFESQLRQSKGGGRSMDRETKDNMESGFGADFSNVRIHTGSEAAGMSNQIGAQAFTHGSDIYFNKGKYDPGSDTGKHLLAHELTHTVQQGASVRRKAKISRISGPRPVQRLAGWIKRGVNWLAERVVPGYTLLNVILGKNIITGEAVARSGVNLIRGYMRLSPVIGSILLSQLEETNTLTEAGKWVEGQVEKFGIDFNDISRRLKLMWEEMSVWKGVKGNLAVFRKHIGPVMGKFMAFSGVVMQKVKELRLEGALRLFGATQLLESFKKDPAAFKRIADKPSLILTNFMKAIKQGFSQFKGNFGKHFKNALFGWLFGKAAAMGIQMPKKFDVAGLFHLVAQLVGVTYEQIKMAAIKKLGPNGQKIFDAVEKTIAVIKRFMKEGPVALFDMAKEFLGNLKEMIFSSITSLVTSEVIKAAVTKVVSMLNPAGAIVQLVLTLYRVVKFFIDNWETIKSIALGILNSIAKVALGKIGDAANFIENIMAKGMQLIISFLARILGLGGIVDKVKKLIKKISAPVKKVRDKVIGWIVKQGRRLFGKGKKGVKDDGKDDKRKYTQKDKNAGLKAFEVEEKPFVKDNKISQENAKKAAINVKKKHPVFKSISVVDGGNDWEYDYIFRKKKSTPSQKSNQKTNGWVLFIRRLTFYAKNSIAFAEKRDGKKKLGYKVDVNGNKGFIVGDKKSKNRYLLRLEKEEKKTEKYNEEFDALNKLGVGGRRKHIQSSESGKSNEEKLVGYNKILTKAGVKKIKHKGDLSDSQLRTYRKQLIKDVIAAYGKKLKKLDQEILNNQNFRHSDFQKIIGSIFEQWVGTYAPGADATEILFLDGNNDVKRRADGKAKGKTLIEMKAVSGKPTQDHLDQMADYASFIANGTKGKLAGGNGKLLKFTKMRYYFSNMETALKWEKDLTDIFSKIEIYVGVHPLSILKNKKK